MSGPSQTCSSAVAGELGCAGAPAALAARLLEQSTACQQFVLYLCFQVGKAKGNMQMRSLRAKSCQLSAWLLAVPHCWCPAPPGHQCCFADGLCSGFLFILIFLYATDFIRNAWKHCCKKYVSGNALLSLVLLFSLFFACYC